MWTEPAPTLARGVRNVSPSSYEYTPRLEVDDDAEALPEEYPLGPLETEGRAILSAGVGFLLGALRADDAWSKGGGWVDGNELSPMSRRGKEDVSYGIPIRGGVDDGMGDEVDPRDSLGLIAGELAVEDEEGPPRGFNASEGSDWGYCQPPIPGCSLYCPATTS
jgi:hypothetical protein